MWLGNYYRTYPKTTVEDEVKQNGPQEFVRGPLAIKHDSPTNLTPGFTVLDGQLAKLVEGIGR